MVLTLHIVTGEPALLGPARLPAVLVADALAPGIQAAAADWLAPDRAEYGHNFLLEGQGDRRVAVMARTLHTDFGWHVEPCLLLSSLMEDHRSAEAAAMLVELNEALGQLGRSCRFVLWALSLPNRPSPQPDLEVVATGLRGLGIQADLAPEPVPMIRPEQNRVLTGRMQLNLLTQAVAREVVVAADELGLRASDPSQLTRLCEPWLAAWQSHGLVPADPLDADHLRRLAQTILRNILSDVSPKGLEPRSRLPA